MAKKSRGMFYYADGIDKVLMLFGTLGCLGDALMSPLTMIILSGILNEYGSGGVSISDDVVNKVCIYQYMNTFLIHSFCLKCCLNN